MEKNLCVTGIQTGAAGWEARLLPLCYLCYVFSSLSSLRLTLGSYHLFLGLEQDSATRPNFPIQNLLKILSRENLFVVLFIRPTIPGNVAACRRSWNKIQLERRLRNGN